MAFDNLHLEKGMYRQTGKSFSQVLESLDPSENYRGTALEGSDAFQRQIKRFGIRLSGPGSDSVEKFFSTLESAVLFPEYVARTVRAGMEGSDVLDKIIATRTMIDAMDYRSIYTDPEAGELEPANVGEGARIPTTQIRSKDHLINLNKRGRMLVASYEAIRFQKLDLFAVTLRQIGAAIRKSLVSDAIGVLLDGDGNGNPAASYTIGTSPISGTAGSLSYEALCDFWAQFDPYELDTMIVPTSVATGLLKLPEFQNPMAGMNFQGSGRMITPLGAQVVRTDAAPQGKILGLDHRYALEMVQAGDVMVEYDKLIDRQLERAAITTLAGFSKIYEDASAVLVI
ncbi:MAG: phage major capsid protein [Oscillospiraceae bacterium]|nr:phage major capsid protein [Oscillospiraceae bacterium]